MLPERSEVEYPKEGKKRKKRKKHTESVMQVKDGRCYLCIAMDGDHGRKPVEEHHVFGGSANRALSEAYGLKVYLCPEHHRTGEWAAHDGKHSGEVKEILHRAGQEAFECVYGSREEFVKVFGKNYL